MKKHVLTLLLFLAATGVLAAQQLGTLRGQITDESGALVPGAKITVTGPNNAAKAIVAGNDGSYSIAGLAPGQYNVVVTSPGLTQFQPAVANIDAGAVATLNIQLRVVLEKQEVTVQENAGPTVSTDPSNNVGALVLRGDDLQALSDDPDDLQADLQALAGPAAGPNGGQIYIDGFTGGTLPNKDAIREIRINQNPFSPEFDKIGFGRIEILTKPGSDKFRGNLYFSYGNGALNSRNPYAADKAPFDLKDYGASVSGPLSKKASFFLDFSRRQIDNGDVINAIFVDPVTAVVTNPYTQVFVSPQDRIRVSNRIDYQLSTNNTLTLRYGFTHNGVTDSGPGGFNLISRSENTLSQDHTVQITETAVLSPKMINETRFQFFDTKNAQAANSITPAISVLSSFNAGGAQVGNQYTFQNNYELQNYTTYATGAHSWKWGVRVRGSTIDDYSPNDFGGAFTFGGGYGPILDANNNPVVPGVVCSNPQVPTTGCETITSTERYRRTVLFLNEGLPFSMIQALGGGPSQFTLNAGNPYASVGQVDEGFFVGDDWRVKPNLTLSLGMRLESQTNINNKFNWAPRLGFAWAPGSTKNSARPKTVFRGGFGLFYDRFSINNVLAEERFNGITQQEYLVLNPAFYPNVPSVSALAQFAQGSTIQEYSSNLHAPYVMQSAIGIERQLPKSTTASVTYTNTHGLHELRSIDINAPLPGTFITGVQGSGVYPYFSRYGTAPVDDIVSDGLYNQNQLVFNVNSRYNKNISIFGYYMLNFARDNTDGASTFPSNPYSTAGEYGPAITDIRNRVFLSGSIATKWDIRLSPFIQLQSGAPFNITAGEDIYGDQEFNARPGIATNPNQPGVIDTKYGLLDPNPTPGEATLPRNFGRGPGQISINLRVAKTFGFGSPREASSGGPGDNGGGPRGGGGRGPGGPGGGGMRMGGGPGGGPGGMFGGATTGKRYNLTLSVQARNILNHVNPATPIGVITSPLFGQSNAIAGGVGAFAENANNRRLELQLRFQF